MGESMSTPVWSLQVAVWQRLTQHSPLMSLVKGVYDEPPQYDVANDGVENTPQEIDFSVYPYVELGYFDELPLNTFDASGKDISMTIHIYSASNNNEELISIRNEIENLLCMASGASRLQLDEHYNIGCLLDFATIIKEPYGIRHMPLRFQIYTKQLTTQ